MDFLSSLIGAGSSLLGGLFGRSSAETIAQQNMQQQLNFAQHGVQWRVNDARAAGINPLAALGISTPGFQNVVGDNSLGEGIKGAGQDISRGIAAMQDKTTRLDELNEKLAEAKINNVNADTARMLAAASSAARSNPPGHPPGIPFPAPNPLRTDWDAYYAKPAMQTFVGPHGGKIVAPSQEFSTATQTLAALPASLAGAAGMAGENLEMARQDIGGNWLPLRADAWRGVDTSQYAPF